jgi:hypothetical protein
MKTGGGSADSCAPAPRPVVLDQRVGASVSYFTGSRPASFFRYGAPSVSHFGAGAPFR